MPGGYAGKLSVAVMEVALSVETASERVRKKVRETLPEGIGKSS